MPIPGDCDQIIVDSGKFQPTEASGIVTTEVLATEDTPKTKTEEDIPQVNWGRVAQLRVTRKVVDALSNLEVSAIHLTSANRRKDARKKYLGYGSRKMLAEAETPFVLERVPAPERAPRPAAPFALCPARPEPWQSPLNRPTRQPRRPLTRALSIQERRVREQLRSPPDADWSGRRGRLAGRSWAWGPVLYRTRHPDPGPVCLSRAGAGWVDCW